MKILISNSHCGLAEFYDAVAKEMGHVDVSELHYDCRKINVSEEIQDNIIEYYHKAARETDPTLSESDIKVGTAMTLITSGPKLDVTLKANEVEVFDGFICFQQSC